MNESADQAGDVLVVRSLGKTYVARGERVVALDNLSFSVGAGRILSVIGPSGSGKSTLLKCIAGLVTVTSGLITIGGEDVVGGRSSPTGFVFQEPRLLPWQNVRHNVAFGLRARGNGDLRRDEVRTRVDHLIDLVGLTAFASAYPAELSGGMCQRVALARSLAIDPDLLLMDEPLSALDELTRTQLQQELLDIIAASAKTALWVTHDLDEALVVGDEVLALGGQPSTIVARHAVPFGRPRQVVSMSKRPEYLDLRVRLLEFLAGETRTEPLCTAEREHPHG